LGKASDYQKLELYRRFFPESAEVEAQDFVEASRYAETMADFQGLLLAIEQEKEHRCLAYQVEQCQPKVLERDDSNLVIGKPQAPHPQFIITHRAG
jgi:hypothetical protein